jgi:hypothetical protein
MIGPEGFNGKPLGFARANREAYRASWVWIGPEPRPPAPADGHATRESTESTGVRLGRPLRGGRRDDKRILSHRWAVRRLSRLDLPRDRLPIPFATFLQHLELTIVGREGGEATNSVSVMPKSYLPKLLMENNTFTIGIILILLLFLNDT